MGAPLPEKDHEIVRWDGRLVARVSSTGGPGFRIYAPDPAALASALESAGVPQAGAETARTVRMEHFHPRYGDDIYENTLPMETQQMRGVHFQKGCYLGQEVVERVRSRGHVNRLLVGFEAETELPPEARSILVAEDGAEVGKVTGAVYSPAFGRTVGMAYVRVTHSSPGTVLRAGATPVRVRALG
jgi:folate-binding protein YgfZ